MCVCVCVCVCVCCICKTFIPLFIHSFNHSFSQSFIYVFINPHIDSNMYRCCFCILVNERSLIFNITQVSGGWNKNLMYTGKKKKEKKKVNKPEKHQYNTPHQAIGQIEFGSKTRFVRKYPRPIICETLLSYCRKHIA